eukprot:188353-Lingulodinium_polyedra.AAC.1
MLPPLTKSLCYRRRGRGRSCPGDASCPPRSRQRAPLARTEGARLGPTGCRPAVRPASLP